MSPWCLVPCSAPRMIPVSLIRIVTRMNLDGSVVVAAANATSATIKANAAAMIKARNVIQKQPPPKAPEPEHTTIVPGCHTLSAQDGVVSACSCDQVLASVQQREYHRPHSR